MDALNLQSPDLYINRELSVLEFNRRVLEQAKDDRVPLLERLRFLCIAGSNLDEFFEIRVSGLKQMQAVGATQRGPTTSPRPSSSSASPTSRTRSSTSNTAC